MKLALTIITFLYSSSSFSNYLFAESGHVTNKSWIEYSSSEETNIRLLLQKLEQSKTGRDLITRATIKARKQNKELLDIIQSGKGSFMDTTLVRRFAANKADNLEYETRSVIHINRHLNQFDALMDLAHELKHFVDRPNFNPYKKDFSLVSFVKNTVEGKGGEVDAFITECRIQKELSSLKRDKHKCVDIFSYKLNDFSRKLAIKKFYEIGGYYKSFKAILEEYNVQDMFPFVSKRKAKFISSAYGSPYPVAALEEYLGIMKKVCSNEQNRLSYMASAPSRSPSSVINAKRKAFKQKCSLVLSY